METTLTDRQIEILKIIERNPGIKHNKLIKIIVEQKKLMAKKTLEKNINELITDHHVKFHKYKKEKQYFRNEEGVSEKDIDKQLEELFCRIFDDISELKKNFKNNEYYVKIRLAHYLFRWMEEFSHTKRTIERESYETDVMDMSEEEEILEEIKKIIKEKDIDWQDQLYKYYGESCEIMSDLSKMKNQYAKLQLMIRKHGTSKKRNELSLKLTQLIHDMGDKFTNLEMNLKELKKTKQHS
ncbi:hypothetical protein [Nitrosopumilus sp.]|uniref:hypothetical protein n=1 Tax=Nitrosopumilus sp. TaxID=2024843 RepID=UPI0034A070BE